MEIKARSVYDRKTIKAVTDFQMFKKRNPKKQKTILLLLMILPFAVAAAFMLITGYDSGAVRPLAVLGTIYALVITMLFSAPKIAYKNNGRVAESVNEFLFEDDRFTVRSSNVGMNGQSQINYENIYKVYETSEYYFVYINRAQIFAVDKSSVDDEGRGQISAKLRSVLGKRKYIVCRY